MMSIPPRFLDEIRNRLVLSEIIGRRIRVIRAGRESKACCPFHHEKSPSFTINDDKQFFHCFGCGAHGDVIKFVMQYDNLSFMDTIEALAAEAGLEVPKITQKEAKKVQEQKDLYALMEDATLFFQETLQSPRNKDAMDYLTGRGLSAETIRMFRLGFAPEDGQALRKVLKAKGYADKDMIAAGVLKPSSKGGEPYVFFRDRVMFPVPDRRGRIVAFGGRVLPEHLRPPQRSDFTPPKYINSSETPLFHKGSMLYGEPIARRAAADGQDLIVVEGYLDVIACVQAGVKGALAPMGTALTENQIVALWKMIPNQMKVPILCFDGDNAGRKAALRVCENIMPLLTPGCSVSFAFMPEGEDPDSLIKAGGPQSFSKVLKTAISLFDYLWASHTAGKVFKTPESRAGVIKALEAQVVRIQDKDVQTHYRALMRQRVSETFFPRFEKQDGRGRRTSEGVQGVAGKRGLLQPPGHQAKKILPRVLLAAVLNHPHIYHGVEEPLGQLRLVDSRLEQLRQTVITLLTREPDMEEAELRQSLENYGLREVIDDILRESVYVHASFCSPRANKEDVERSWLAYWKDWQSAALDKEMQSGWRRAYQNSDEQEEERLRAVLLLKTSDKAV